MIDVFNHFLPPAFVSAVQRLSRRPPLMFERACQIPAMTHIDFRCEVMRRFPGYRQIISLASPTVEVLAAGQEAAELAQVGNDALAELTARHADRFPGFIASLPMDSPKLAIREAERSMQQLKAAGVQLYTNVRGKPLDRPETLEIIDALAELRCPIWLHPIRPMTAPDYPEETVSKFDLWWAFGWPHETSVAMGRLVFAGVFDRWPELTIITHHGGGTIPLFAGRIEHGLSKLGTRNPPEHCDAVATPLLEPPLPAFRRFFADTATFGSTGALRCALDFFGAEQILFATDMPFDPEGGTLFIRESLRAIDELGLPQSIRSAILEDNAKRILRLP
jgi:uncharacterized protein